MSRERTSTRRAVAGALALVGSIVIVGVVPFAGCAYHATFCEAHPDHCGIGGSLATSGAGASTATSGSMATGSTSTGSMCPVSCDDMNPCTIDSCDNTGACTHTNAADNTVVPDTMVGDCKKSVCIAGASTLANDDTDIPPDTDPNDCKKPSCSAGAIVMVNNDTEAPTNGNDCQVGSCANGTPQFASKPNGTACGAGGAFMCLSGKCGCNAPTDCGSNTACGTWSCTANVCNLALVAAGNAPPQFQTAGDCQDVTCNGSSATPATQYDANDPTVGNNPCVKYSCNNTQPPTTIQTNLAAGTACQGAHECNGAGVCCAPNGLQCSGVQCGPVVDNCNTTHNCGACGGSVPACAGGQCVQCANSADCASNAQGHACLLSSHTCGCASSADCAGLANAGACDPQTAACVECYLQSDCASSPHGRFCGVPGPNQCGCLNNQDCLGVADGIDCNTAGPNLCGCSVSNQCMAPMMCVPGPNICQ